MSFTLEDWKHTCLKKKNPTQQQQQKLGRISFLRSGSSLEAGSPIALSSESSRYPDCLSTMAAIPREEKRPRHAGPQGPEVPCTAHRGTGEGQHSPPSRATYQALSVLSAAVSTSQARQQTSLRHTEVGLAPASPLPQV